MWLLETDRQTPSFSRACGTSWSRCSTRFPFSNWPMRLRILSVRPAYFPPTKTNLHISTDIYKQEAHTHTPNKSSHIHKQYKTHRWTPCNKNGILFIEAFFCLWYQLCYIIVFWLSMLILLKQWWAVSVCCSYRSHCPLFVYFLSFTPTLGQQYSDISWERPLLRAHGQRSTTDVDRQLKELALRKMC